MHGEGGGKSKSKSSCDSVFGLCSNRWHFKLHWNVSSSGNGLMCDDDPCRVDPTMLSWELNQVAELGTCVAEVIASGSA